MPVEAHKGALVAHLVAVVGRGKDSDESSIVLNLLGVSTATGEWR